MEDLSVAMLVLDRIHTGPATPTLIQMAQTLKDCVVPVFILVDERGPGQEGFECCYTCTGRCEGARTVSTQDQLLPPRSRLLRHCRT